jgi:hypothetical protein
MEEKRILFHSNCPVHCEGMLSTIAGGSRVALKNLLFAFNLYTYSTAVLLDLLQ